MFHEINQPFGDPPWNPPYRIPEVMVKQNIDDAKAW
jgi:hypothetical protein